MPISGIRTCSEHEKIGKALPQEEVNEIILNGEEGLICKDPQSDLFYYARGKWGINVNPGKWYGLTYNFFFKNLLGSLDERVFNQLGRLGADASPTLRLFSPTFTFGLIVPLEIYSNYDAVKRGTRNIKEAVVDGLVDSSIGGIAAFTGAWAFASVETSLALGKLGAEAGTVVNPGIGTLFGFLAGCAVGFGIGFFLDAAKEYALY